MDKTIRGYKVFNSDMMCRGFHYEVGETYTHDGEIGLYNAGFHFCLKPADIFGYYPFNSSNHVAEIEASGVILHGTDKSVCSQITILRELNWHEVLELVNTGKDNTGRNNTGDSNTGHCNTGDWNTGDWNTGHRNTGDWNTGHWNTGDSNTGDWNTGHWNTGRWNTGDWNSANYSAGCFCTKESKFLLFDKPSPISRNEFYDSKAWYILSRVVLTKWIGIDNMTDAEKADHPEHQTTGGYLRSYTYEEACIRWWNALDDDERSEIQRIPNFSAEKFRAITGIDVKKARE